MANILIVDDEPGIRRLLAKWLTNEGYSVFEAASGSAAVECAQERLLSLIIMDVKLPDMTGFAATERIRGIPGYRALPVVCLTGLEMRMDVAHEGGCTDLLLKPVERVVLLSAVRRNLRTTATQT